MKTVFGHSVSTKEISLSKAAKILSKFVSADNGASQAISAYVQRASASFNELNQLHKELKSAHSHKKKHKTDRTETGDEENVVQSVETTLELSNGLVKSKNEFGRQKLGSENVNEEKSAKTSVKFNQKVNGSIDYQEVNVGGNDKHKKNMKNKQEDEYRLDGDSKLPTRAQNEIESGQEKGHEGDSNPGMEKGKKQKKEKEKKKHKEGSCNFSSNKVEAENLEGENSKGQELQKEIEKALNNNMEGENGIDPQDLKIKKKKKYEAGSENKLDAEEPRTEQRKKRKSENVEERQEDRSGDQSKKKKKKKHEG